jgi:hypothetical protein
VTIGENGASFTWDEDDVIGIFPDKGDQVSFAMEEGAGTQTATFSGGGWALKSSAKYAAYYPHVYENRDMTAIPVSYVGQTQNGNGNTDHIGAYDFMAAGVSTPENGAVAFHMQHLGALVQLTITVPEPSTLNKVVLTSSTEFTETGTIDLTVGMPSITAYTASNTFEVALNNVATREANENVTIYFMVAPVDLSESELTAAIHLSDETVHETEIIGKNLQAGKAYRLTAEFKETIPNNQIWYTNGSTTEPTTPYATNAFDANIVSNTYDVKKECWVIKFDGELTAIGLEAFYFRNLVTIAIPNSVIAINGRAFNGCQKLTDVQLSENITKIAFDAFNLCTSLESIEIPNGVITIENRAFSSCSKLSCIVIPDSVTAICEDAFRYCDGLNSATIGRNVATIGNNAFYYCKSLTSLTIPDSVTVIGDYAFYQCDKISTLVLGNSLTQIGAHAFQFCKSLTEVTIPDSVTTIEVYGFEFCENLSSVTLGSGLTNIKSYAFYNCDKLSNIYSKASTPPNIDYHSMLSSDVPGRKIHVPMASVMDYKARYGWRDYADDIIGYDF